MPRLMVDPALWAQVEAAAARAGVTPQAWVRAALEHALEHALEGTRR